MGRFAVAGTSIVARAPIWARSSVATAAEAAATAVASPTVSASETATTSAAVSVTAAASAAIAATLSGGRGRCRLVVLEAGQRLLDSKRGEVDSTHLVDFMHLHAELVADVDDFLDPAELLGAEVLLRHHAFPSGNVLHHRAASHDSGDFAPELGAYGDLVGQRA